MPPQATLESLAKKRCDDIAAIREAHVSNSSTWAVNTSTTKNKNKEITAKTLTLRFLFTLENSGARQGRNRPGLQC